MNKTSGDGVGSIFNSVRVVRILQSPKLRFRTYRSWFLSNGFLPLGELLRLLIGRGHLGKF
jgi:hypothetical protein